MSTVGFLDYAIEGDDNKSGWLTQAIALDRYRPGRFEIVVAQQNMLKPFWPAIHDANPDIEWAAYTNGTHYSGPIAFPADWYVKGSTGLRVRSKAFPTNYLMNPLSTSLYQGYAGWNAYKLAQSKALLASSGASALYIDELGVGPIFVDGITDGPAIDPRTKQPWTWAAWMVQMNMVLDTYLTIPVPIYANGLGNGGRFFEPPLGTDAAKNGGNTAPLLQHSEGMLMESFLRGAKMPNESATTSPWYPSVAPNRLSGVSPYDRELRAVEQSGSNAWFCTKVWTGSAQTNSVLNWALATFLLGYKPGQLWYSTGKRASTVTPWRAEWTSAKLLGAPLGPRIGYTRAFEGGTVAVNPSAHTGSIVLA